MVIMLGFADLVTNGINKVVKGLLRVAILTKFYTFMPICIHCKNFEKNIALLFSHYKNSHSGVYNSYQEQFIILLTGLLRL